MKRYFQLLIMMIIGLLARPASGQELPEIGYFNLSAGGGKVYLAWQLKAGYTCLGIRVHRSDDGFSFTEIGGIPGVCGDLTRPESYTFIDEDPPLNQRVYYRLELGFGNFTEARFVDVIDLGGGNYQLRPNPVTTSSQLFFENATSEDHLLTISDLNGKMVHQQTTRNDRFILRAIAFARGLYIFSITSSGKTTPVTGKILILPQ
jgi:hypothetical protein